MELPNENELLENLLNNAQVAILIADSNQIIMRINPEFTRLFGYSANEAIGKNIYNLIVPDKFRDESEQVTERLVKGERVEFETVRQKKDGRMIHVLGRVSPIIINGKRIGGFAFYSDISKAKHAQEELQKAHDELEMRVQTRTEELTRANEKLQSEIRERKRIEAALRESEEGYRTAIEHCNDAVAILQGDRLVYVNQRFADMHGYESPEEVIGKPLHVVVHPDDLQRVRDLAMRRQKGKLPAQKYELRAIRKDGTAIHLENSVTKTIYHGEVVSLAYLRDITDRKRVEEERRQFESQLQHAQRMEAIGTLAGGIAHDFNNILSAIIGYTELVLNEGDNPSFLKSNLQEVLNAGNRAKDLVKQILAFSRQSEHEMIPVQIKSIVKEALKLLRASIPTTIKIQQNIESEAAVLADPTQIHQVLMNLCTNAEHAMRKSGGILTVGLTEKKFNSESINKNSTITPGKYLCLQVSDTGQGMDAYVIDRIFNPFFTTKSRDEGTGMGLAVVHGIVKGHGGEITVQSQAGKGSTFNIYLPINESEIKGYTQIKEIIPTGTERILFIDDEKPLVDLGQLMLKRLGYDVSTRTSSIEALELFKAQSDRFDLVITDMTMPNMTGEKLAKELIKIRSDIPVILCTGYSQQITEEKAREMGIREFILKPMTMNKLANSIRKALGD